MSSITCDNLNLKLQKCSSQKSPVPYPVLGEVDVDCKFLRNGKSRKAIIYVVDANLVRHNEVIRGKIGLGINFAEEVGLLWIDIKRT